MLFRNATNNARMSSPSTCRFDQTTMASQFTPDPDRNAFGIAHTRVSPLSSLYLWSILDKQSHTCVSKPNECRGRHSRLEINGCTWPLARSCTRPRACPHTFVFHDAGAFVGWVVLRCDNSVHTRFHGYHDHHSVHNRTLASV